VHKAPPPPDWSKNQKVLNEHWPQTDRRGQLHARDVPDQKHPIAVRVRVVWERDGEEWIEEGMARRWTHARGRTRASVYVTFDDERLRGSGVWVAPSDVKRRGTGKGSHGQP